MTALVLALAAAVALLGVLVVSLLRSHAEILRRLHEIDPAYGGHGDSRAGHDHGPTPVEMGVRPGVALPREHETPAHDVTGITPAGEEVGLALLGGRSSTLLAFLSSGCLTCLDFWHAFAGDVVLPDGVRLVVLTKGAEQESTSRVAELAPAGVTVVLSTKAWVDYEVPMAPYFILVDGPSGAVKGEGAASSWSQLVDLMGQALDDGPSRRGRRRPAGAAERESRIDRELAAAGIEPGDPSLHPDRDAFGSAPR
jgi:hypothetical protein